MRDSWLSVLYFRFAISAGSAQTPQSASSQTFPLPTSHLWELKTTQICSSVGRVGIRPAKETPDPSERFLVEAGRGDSRLEITMGYREVLVSVDGAQPEKYKVVANTVGVLTAVLIGEIEPSVSSIDPGRFPRDAKLLDLERPSESHGRVRFTHDGKAVVHALADQDSANLWLQPLDGSPGKQITNFKSEQIRDFHSSFDGRKLGLVRGNVESDVVLLRESKP